MSGASPRQHDGFSIGKANHTGAPAFSIGLRNKWKNEDYRRGPGSYNPGSVNSPSTPAFSMGAKLKPKANDSWQRGPGSYEVGDLKRGPSFSLGSRDLHKGSQSTGPGPGSYNVEQSSFTRASAPSYSMAGRCAAAPNTQSPGPGAYNISPTTHSKGGGNAGAHSGSRMTTDSAGLGRSTMKSAPAFSFGMRSSAHIDRTPGPGAYNSATRSPGPAFSIASRSTKVKGGKDLNPGPGAYDVTSNVVRRSGPSFTIAHKA
jgi:hypothetical protein